MSHAQFTQRFQVHVIQVHFSHSSSFQVHVSSCGWLGNVSNFDYLNGNASAFRQRACHNNIKHNTYVVSDSLILLLKSDFSKWG